MINKVSTPQGQQPHGGQAGRQDHEDSLSQRREPAGQPGAQEGAAGPEETGLVGTSFENTLRRLHDRVVADGVDSDPPFVVLAPRLDASGVDFNTYGHLPGICRQLLKADRVLAGPLECVGSLSFLNGQNV